MESANEKTELPTQKKLDEAIRKGQYAKSQEVQTVVVLAGGMLALMFTGHETWQLMTNSFRSVLGHLHEVNLTRTSLQSYAGLGAVTVTRCVWPLMLAAVVGGVLAGGIQSRFQAAPEALRIDWERLSPLAGLKRLFSMRSTTTTALAMLKLATIIALTYGQVIAVLAHPIFYTPVDVLEVGRFLADTSIGIIMRVCMAMGVIAALDYTFQFWKTSQDMMMTKQEIKDEAKGSEANPQLRSRQRKMRQRQARQQMLDAIPSADVVVTNPTHFAVALKYDRKTMKAPHIVAKGTRLHALKIREIAKAHKVPIVENKPLARMMFKHGKVGGEVPAQLYAAVAEILAWVYRMNRYRYYSQENRRPQAEG